MQQTDYEDLARVLESSAHDLPGWTAVDQLTEAVDALAFIRRNLTTSSEPSGDWQSGRSSRTTAEAERTCGTCGARIFYGLYCSNDCSDAGYRQWLKERAESYLKSQGGTL